MIKQNKNKEEEVKIITKYEEGTLFYGFFSANFLLNTIVIYLTVDLIDDYVFYIDNSDIPTILAIVISLNFLYFLIYAVTFLSKILNRKKYIRRIK